MATRRRKSSDANADDAQSQQEPIQLDDQQADELRQQLTETLQPMIENLRLQISDTVQQQIGAQGGQASGTSAQEPADLDQSLGSLGGWIQQAIDKVVELVQRFLAWVRELFGELGEKVAEAIGTLAGAIVQRAIKSAL